MAHLMEVIRAVRNIRSELNVPPTRKVEVRLKGQHGELAFLRDHEEIVRRLAARSAWTYVDPDYIPVQDATAVVNDIGGVPPPRGG